MSDERRSDRDQELAEKIGQALEANMPLEEAGEDDLLSLLVDYRAPVDATVSDETRERLWAGIEAEIESEESGAVPSQPKTSRRKDRAARTRERSTATRTAAVWRYAVVASLLVAVGVVTWLTLRSPSPTVVAEATTAVVRYEAEDGSVVRLRPHSTLTRLPEDAASAGGLRFRLDGEARFDVTPRSESPFVVEARDAVVEVLGTQFTVQTWTEDPVVFLQEGRVRLTNRTSGRDAVLAPGERGVVSGADVRSESASARAYLDWLDGEIVFDSRPAREVADELAQHYGIRIQLPDSVAQERITGQILLDAQPQSLRDFRAVLGGSFERRGETYRFTRQ